MILPPGATPFDCDQWRAGHANDDGDDARLGDGVDEIVSCGVVSFRSDMGQGAAWSCAWSRARG